MTDERLPIPSLPADPPTTGRRYKPAHTTAPEPTPIPATAGERVETPEPTPTSLATTEPAADFGGTDLATAPFTWKTLHAISRTDLVPKAIRGNTPAILAVILYGREWDLGPMESLQLIDMIEGSPSPAAQLLVAKVCAAGHELFPGEITADSATAVLIRHDPGLEPRRHEYTFTMADAQRAGIAGKHNFKTYPGVMLYWRAASQLARFAAPDVLGPSKAYLPDELGSADWVGPQPQATVDTVTGEIVEC